MDFFIRMDAFEGKARIGLIAVVIGNTKTSSQAVQQ